MRGWTFRGAAACVTGLLVASIVALFIGPGDDGMPTSRVLGEVLGQDVTVDRPPGQLMIEEVTLDAHGNLELRVLDTRGDDPGWTVTVTGAGGTVRPTAVFVTAPFHDGAGRLYRQQVTAGAAVATWAAAPGHGLGIAHLRAKVIGSPALSITIS